MLVENHRPMQVFTNSYNGSFKLINNLNWYFGTRQFGTVLDTCHALSSIRTMERVAQGYSCFKIPTLEDYYKENKDYIKLVHLANCVNLGILKEEHGTAFKTKEEMYEVIKPYFTFDYTCPVVLEIQEDNYLKPVNLVSNCEMLGGIIVENS